MIDLSNLEAWFVTGSQHLYGAETLKKVGQHASAIATALAASPEMPVKIVAKPVMTSSESIPAPPSSAVSRSAREVVSVAVI